jgi:hypothetical protein
MDRKMCVGWKVGVRKWDLRNGSVNVGSREWDFEGENWKMGVRKWDYDDRNQICNNVLNS